MIWKERRPHSAARSQRPGSAVSSARKSPLANASQVRNVQLVGVASNIVLGTFEAAAGTTVTSVEVAEGGTYRLGSAGSGIAVYYVIIEYFE